MKKIFLLVGRICLSLIFVSSAVGKILNWDETVQYMTGALAKWSNGVSMPDLVAQGFSLFCSYAVMMLVVATIFEGVGGLFVLLGFKVRLGAVLLTLFIIPVTLIMHPFWLMGEQEKMMQMTMFMKNLSILGGLMILAAKGGENEAA